jgi:hypothetical protein
MMTNYLTTKIKAIHKSPCIGPTKYTSAVGTVDMISVFIKYKTYKISFLILCLFTTSQQQEMDWPWI